MRTRARRAGSSRIKFLMIFPAATPLFWLTLTSTEKRPCRVTNLIIGTFALAMMVTRSVIPARFMVFASAWRTEWLLLYAIDSERMTRSISLEGVLSKMTLYHLRHDIPKWKVQLRLVAAKRQDLGVRKGSDYCVPYCLHDHGPNFILYRCRRYIFHKRVHFFVEPAQRVYPFSG